MNRFAPVPETTSPPLVPSFLAMVLVLLASAAGATAQAPSQGMATTPAVAPGLEVAAAPGIQYFRFSDGEAAGIESMSLVSTPFAAALRVADRFRFRVNGGWARGSMDRPQGGSTELSGLVDTRLRLDADVVPGTLIVSGVLGLATGIDGFGPDEVELAGAVAADLLPFAISNWGSGGGGGVSVTALAEQGNTAFGLDVGMERPGEFTPSGESAAAYRPGTSFHVMGVVDQVLDNGGKVSLRADVRRFGDGQVDGVNVFRSGTRAGFTGSWAFPSGARSSGILYAGYRHRTQGTFLLELDSRPTQGAVILGGGLRTPAAGGMVTPSAEFRAIRTGDGADQGWRIGAGATGEWDAGALVFQPGFRLHLGDARIARDVTSSFTGLEVSIQLRRSPGIQP